MDIHQNSLFDEEDGMWLVDVPYILFVDSKENITRAYVGKNISKGLTRCNDPLMIPWKESHGTNFRMNGKPYGSIFPILENYPIKVNPPKKIKLISPIDHHLNDWYDIFYLVCGNLKGLSVEDWFNRAQSCTTIGTNIAKSMVNVASTRIFNNPAQSIIEIIANGIDSYATLEGKSKVGRFGMGFFSFLYPLVNHPKRCLNIITTCLNKGVYSTKYLRIREINQSLKFSISLFDTKTQTTGTMMHLDAGNDKFTEEEFVSFSRFIEYLSMITSVPIVNVTTKTMINRLPFPDSPKKAITVECTQNKIMVTEQAEGMSLDTILNSLLVPSISTKGIRVGTQSTQYENYSSIEKESNPSFKIMINRVIVVKLKLVNTKYSVNLSLPSNAVLPVTRDDVVISSVQKEFENSLNILLQMCIKVKDLTVLENALDTYKEFTANSDNRMYLDSYIDFIYSENSNKVIIKKDDVPVYDELYPNYIIGTRVNTNVNENILKEIEPGDTNIFLNKRVVLMKNIQDVTTGSTFSYLFIPHSIYSVPNWDKMYPLACKFDYLTHTSWKENSGKPEDNSEDDSEDDSEDYSEDEKEIKTESNINDLADEDSDEGSSSELDDGDFVIKQPKTAMGFLKFYLRNQKEMLKYADKLIHVSSAIQNAYTVKFSDEALRSPYNVRVVIAGALSLLTEIYSLFGEDYLIDCINKWIIMVKSIATPENYGAEKTLRSYTSYLIQNIPSTYDTGIKGFKGLNYKNIFQPQKEFPNAKRLFREYFDSVFRYCTELNKQNSPYGYLHPISTDLLLFVNRTKSFSGNGRYVVKERYIHNILKLDFNLTEASLGMICLEHLDDKFHEELMKSPQFYKKIKTLYRKYLKGKTDYKDVSIEWWYDSLLHDHVLDVILAWAKEFITSEVSIPVDKLDMKIKPQFTAKQLINYVFKHDDIDFSKLQYENKELVLQILEISINAGTTKPFLEATLTELIQNSMDAIRLTNPENRSIHIKTNKVGNGLISISVQDYVGMSIENLVAISIPFYSNKKASEIVTGEMGTGFFNVYRESIFVLIDTVRNGVETKFLQVPIRDSNRDVSDISTEMRKVNTTRSQGTTITFVVKCSDTDEELSVYNNVHSFSHDVIGLMDFEGIFFNGNKIKLNKRLIYRTKDLECYYASSAPVSYLFTKGVPFAPLYDFLSDKEDKGISSNLLDNSRGGILINIKHGFYTPVQSRTRLNIETTKLKIFHDFLFHSLSRCIFEKLYLIIRSNEVNMYATFLDTYFRDWSFSGNIHQVVPTAHITENLLNNYQEMRKDWDVRTIIFNYVLPCKNFYTVQSVISYIANNSTKVKGVVDKVYTMMNKSVLSSDDLLFVNKVQESVKMWINFKDFQQREQKSSLILPPARIPNKDKEMYIKKLKDYIIPISQSFVDIFVQMSKKYPKLKYPDGITVDIVPMPAGMQGYYNPARNQIVLGGVLQNIATDIESFAKNITKYIKDNGSLRTNGMYQSIFGYTEPSSTIVHEIEHARRVESHDAVGAHDDIQISLFGEPVKKYLFSELSNFIYLKLVGDGLIINWLNAIKDIKLNV